jgi:hypothetical protein
MNRRKIIILTFLAFFYGVLMVQNASFSQSKKKQIEALNFKIDSVNHVIAKERNTQKISIDSLQSQETKSKQKVDSLTKEINSVKNQISSHQKTKQKKEFEIGEIKNEIETKKDSLEDLIISQIVKWEIDTLEVSFKNTKCFSFRNGKYLFIKSAPVEDSTIQTINLGLEKLKSKIPEIINGTEKPGFIGDCKEWLDKLCDRPWIVSNDIVFINYKKYFSVLQMSQLEYCGATWASRGFSSYMFNLNAGEEIKIQNNQTSKEIIKQEIKNHFEKLKKTDPYFETQLGKETIDYDSILEEIMKFSITNLTFFFKDEELSLAYYYYEDSWSNRTFFIPLPILQKNLNL